METILTVVLEGKEVHLPVRLSEDQVRHIYNAAVTNTKLTGWEKPTEGDAYYYEDAAGRIQTAFLHDDSGELQVNMLYDIANCYASQTIGKDMARGDALIRRLHRFAVEHRTMPLDRSEGGYTILYNYESKCLEVGFTGCALALGDVLFESEEIAQSAINEYYSELLWYFTELRDSL